MATVAAEHSARNTAGEYRELPVRSIRPSGFNPRKAFDPEGIAELAADIRERGLIQPIVVRAVERRLGMDGVDHTGATVSRSHVTVVEYEIVAGERRWRAAVEAGLETVPVRIMALDDKQALEVALIENLQRRDLDPIEEAEGYRALREVAGLKQAEIAGRVNRKQPAVAKALGLLELPEDVRERIRTGELSVAHGVALRRYRVSPDLVRRLAALAVEEGWTTKKLDSPNAALGSDWELRNSNLVQSLQQYGTEFDIAVCERCPFGARQESYCLRPSHYQELQEAARKEKQAEASRAIQKASDGGEKVLRLSKLSYNAYERLEYGRPDGCTQECPCRRQALDHGNRTVWVCTDPARYRQLKAAETRKENAAKRAEHKRRVSALEERIAGLGGFGGRELALLATVVLANASKPTAVKQAAEHVGVADRLPLEKFVRWELREKFAEFAKLSVGELVRLGVEAVLRDELANRYEGYGGKTPMLDWYLGEEGKADG